MDDLWGAAAAAAGDGSASAAAATPKCTAWCWIGLGAAGLLLFAPFGLAARRYLPPKVSAHAAMVLAQIVFGAGTVLVGGDMKAHPIDPVVFALVREAMAGGCLGILAALLERTLPRAQELPRIFAIGLGVWGTNLLFIFGVQWVSDANAASVGTLMQPCLPVVTTLMAIVLGFENSTRHKIGGISLAIAGSVLVVVLGQLAGTTTDDASGSRAATLIIGGGDKALLLKGTLTLLCQAFCNAAYILLQRKLLQPPRSFPVLTLTAMGFMVAAFCMSLFSYITPGWHAPKSTGAGGWDLPNEAWLPIVYWVFAGSCIGYSCCSRANFCRCHCFTTVLRLFCDRFVTDWVYFDAQSPTPFSRRRSLQRTHACSLLWAWSSHGSLTVTKSSLKTGPK